MPKREPFPNTAKPAGRLEMGCPLVYAWLKPEMRKPMESVAIKSGIPRYATAVPLAAPSSAPANRPMRQASHMFIP